MKLQATNKKIRREHADVILKENIEHEAWMARLRERNLQEVKALTSDSENKLNAIKSRSCANEQRYRQEGAQLQATHLADMVAIEEKHQIDLAQTMEEREDNRVRHQGRMAAMSIKHQHETDTMELRQREEVDELSRVNDAKMATQTADMCALKGRNQSKMDKMCSLMYKTEAMEKKLEASTVRYFKLANQVNEQRAEMRRYADLERESDTLLSVQMEHIDAMRKEIADNRENSRKWLRDVDKMTSLEKLYALLDAIIAARKGYHLRLRSGVTVIANISRSLLAKHENI